MSELKEKYFGITIGPIFESISEATKPAALWFASTLFSDLSFRLCRAIRKEWGEAVVICAPFFDGTEDMKDGVGKYHDRIFFSVKDENASEKLDRIIREEKENTIGSAFPGGEWDSRALSSYLYAKYVALDELCEGKNILNSIGPKLDCLELMPAVQKDSDDSPLKVLLNGENVNDLVKESNLLRKVTEFGQLLKYTDRGGFGRGPAAAQIRSIEDIAGAKDPEGNRQRTHYFAVVSADGDRVGKTIAGLNEAKDILNFSGALLSYDKMASEEIAKFGGMTIYAGGDDLLFLAPVVGENGDDVFSLCSRLSEKFLDALQEKNVPVPDPKPAVSFGVAVRYVKYPLFEALKASRELLERIKEGEERGLILTDIQKHSGQSAAFRIPAGFAGELQKLLRNSASDEQIRSVEHIVEDFRSLVNQIALPGYQIDEEKFKTVMGNLFDNEDQQRSADYLDNLFGFIYENLLKKNNFCSADDKGHTFADDIGALLRVQSFLEAEESKDRSGKEGDEA